MLHPALRGIPGLIGGVLIDRGGSSRIYRARQDQLGRTVVVKIINNSAGASAAAEFEAECRALGQLNHDHVVMVFGAGRTDQGERYIVLDYHHRGSLGDRISRLGRLPTGELMTVVNHMASGLRAAHEAKIIHGDVKPANVLVDVAGRALLVDFGIAQMMRDGPISVDANTPRFAAPEVRACGEITTASDVYSLAATVRFAAGVDSPAGSMAHLHRSLGPDIGDVIEASLDPEPSQRPTVDELIAASASAPIALPHHVDEPFRRILDPHDGYNDHYGRCPYKGLSSYEPEDGPWFFGRDRHVSRLLDLVIEHPLVAVVGSSGSGKSSLVRAGLLPLLKADGPLGRDVSTMIVVPSDAMMSPVEGIVDIREHPSSEPTIQERQAATFHPARSGSMSAGSIFLANSWSKITIVDQFEEVFTALDSDSANRYIDDLLARAAHDNERIVIVLRDEFLGRCNEHTELAEAISSALLLVGGIRGDELAESIRRPALQSGLKVQPELVEELVEAADGRLGALPLISHALTEAWAHHRGDELTLADYHAAGAIEGAVAETAAEVYAGLDSSQRRALRGLLLRMVTISEDSTFLRRRLRRDELAEMDPAGVTGPVVSALVARRILTARAEYLEVAHESLFTAWPMLNEWLEAERTHRQVKQSLERDSALWDQEGRLEADLWRGSRLEQAIEWMDDTRLVAPVHRQFIVAAQEVRDRTERDLRAANQRMARRNRFLRKIAVALVGAVVISATSGVVFLIRSETAKDDVERAEKRSELDAAAAQRAMRASELAEVESTFAERAAQRAEALARQADIETRRADAVAREIARRGLVSEVNRLAVSDNELALLLAAEVATMVPGTARYEALANALNGGDGVASISFEGSSQVDASGHLISLADGWSLVARSSNSTETVLWRQAESRPGPDGVPLAANPAGDRVLLSNDGSVLIWNQVSDTSEVLVDEPAIAASWAGDDSVALVRPDRSVFVFAVVPEDATAALVSNLDGVQVRPGTGEAHRGPGWTAVSTSNGVVVVADSGEVMELAGYGNYAESTSLAIDRAAQHLAVAAEDGVRVWTVNNNGKSLAEWPHRVLGRWARNLSAISFLESDRLVGVAASGDATMFNIIENEPVLVRGPEPRSSEDRAGLDHRVVKTRGGFGLVGTDPASGITYLDTWESTYTGLPHQTIEGSGAAAAVGDAGLLIGEYGQVTSVDSVTGVRSRHQRVAPAGPELVPYTLALGTIEGFGAGITESLWSGDLVVSAAQSADGSVLGAYYLDGMVDVWASDGTHLYTSPWGAVMAGRDGFPVTGGASTNFGEIALSPNGRFLVISNVGLYVVDLRTGQELIATEDEWQFAAFGRVEITDDGIVLATTGSKIYRFDPASGTSVEKVWEVGYIRPLALSKDQGTIYVGNGESGSDTLIQPYDVVTFEPNGDPLRGHDERVTALAVSPGGTVLYSASLDGTVRRWDLSSSQGVAGIKLLTGETYMITDLQTDLGGLYVFTAEGRRIRIDLDETAWINKACEKAGRSLTRQEWSTYLPQELNYTPVC